MLMLLVHFEGHFSSQTLYSHPIQPAPCLVVSPEIFFFFLKQSDSVIQLLLTLILNDPNLSYFMITAHWI